MNLAQEHYEEKAEQSRKNKANGGSNVTIDLLKTVKIRFNKAFGYNKAGAEITVSETAYEIYNKAGVIEKVN